MMNRWQKWNLWRATPAIALSTAIVVLVAGLAVAYSGSRYNGQRQIDRAIVQGQILASAISATLAFNDRMAAQEYVQALQADPAVFNAAVYDADGKLFTSFARLADHPSPALLQTSGTTVSSNYVTVITPVTQGSMRLGSVYLRASIDSSAQRLRRYGIVGLLSTMAAIVVAVLGIAQLSLSRANGDLELQSLELVAANKRLLQQINEREKAEAALRQAQKMEAIGHLTGGVAHDFNNLLQIILASLDMLQRKSAGWNLPAAATRDFTRFLDAATIGGQRAASLTRQLLAFARRQSLEPTKIEVDQLVAGMSELLRRTLGEQITVETVLSGGLWSIFADANQLESALINLAVNARDAMADGGRLTIETANAALDENYVRLNDDAEPGQYVMIAVSDTGTGMTREVIAQAFEPFFTTKDIGRGTGLGLSQVYGFVKQSGGHIKIYSEAGHGTTVRLYLPRLVAAGEEIEPAADEQHIPQGTRSETILVVEDEDEVRAFSSEMLRELGYNVLEAADGHAALHIIDNAPSIQLLFTDIGLPNGMNGRQLAEEALKRSPGLKVLFTSGYARHAVTPHGRPDAGMMLLGKPFTYGALAEKVRQVFNGA